MLHLKSCATCGKHLPRSRTRLKKVICRACEGDWKRGRIRRPQQKNKRGLTADEIRKRIDARRVSWHDLAAAGAK
jgi:hypothetical protein